MANTLPITLAPRELRKLTEAARALLDAGSVDDVSQLTVDRAADLLSADRVVLCLADEHGLLSLAGARGVDQTVCRRLRDLPPSQAVQRIEEAFSVPAEHLIVSPLTIENRIGGLLAVAVTASATDAARRHDWLLAAVGDHAAVAIENGRRRQAGPQSDRVAGEPNGVAGAVVDVTERKTSEDALRQTAEQLRRLNMELEEAIRSKDQFLITLSHDLRTPLTAIGGWVRLLQSAKLSPEQAARALDVIARNVKTQTRIVDDLLDVSRIATGELHVHPIWCDAAAVVESALDGIRPAAAAKDIRLETTVAPEGVRMFADPQRLQQVLFHLLSNAVKFTGRSGQVTITCRCEDNETAIVITDNGEGIAPQLVPHMFDRPSPAEGSAGREHGSRGLGLAIVRHLVALHGGRTTVHSDGKGLGTTLTVRLPLPQAAEVSPTDGAETAVRRPA